MKKTWMKWILLSFLLILLAACNPQSADLVPTIAPTGMEEIEDLSEVEIDASNIFSTKCARCHGPDRSGANAPALLPERLTQAPEVYLETIKNGSGPMPAWESRLSPAEISALVAYILSDPQ